MKKILVILLLSLILIFIAVNYIFDKFFLVNKNYPQIQLPGNPAKKLAAIMIPFAQKYKLVKLYEYDGKLSMENPTPYYIYVYLDNRLINDSENLLKNYLESNGYKIREMTRSIPSGLNNGYPFWELQGTNVEKNYIQADITDHEYYIPINDGKFGGTHSIQQGNSVIIIHFSEK